MKNKKSENSVEFMKKVNELLREGYAIQEGVTKKGINNYIQKVGSFLSNTTDEEDCYRWKFLSVNARDINGNLVLGRHSSEIEMYRSKLKSIIEILLTLKSEKEYELQFKELKKQTEYSRNACTISIAGLLIAIVVPIILQKCGNDIKFENRQFDTLIQSIERKVPMEKWINDSTQVDSFKYSK